MSITYTETPQSRNISMHSHELRKPGVKGTRNLVLCFLLAAAAMAPHGALAADPAPQSPVDLGSTANFTILAGAAITTTGGGIINGDIGAYPIDGASILIPPNQVNGTVYARDPSGTQAPNVVIDPALLLAAKGDLTIAYNDAAGRTPIPSGPFLNPQGGNIGGLNLVPGLYKFTTTAYITGKDVTLTGGPNDVWIFQCAQDLQVGTGRKVILAGGARAKNVFWQVGTSAVLETFSDFKGTILADQAITMKTSSTLEGRALAFTAGVTFNGTGGSLPSTGKAINPTPANGATNQLINVQTSWDNGGGATSYDVYFGTNILLGVADFQGNQTGRSFSPDSLSYTNTYYWRIDSLTAEGMNPGDVWFFKAENEPSHGSMQFSVSTDSIAENSAALNVKVTRLNGSYGPASVDFATADGTATDGVDYTATNGTLNWLAGELSAKTFTVAIIDNVLYEGNKTFLVELDGATGANLGIPALETVTIKENDSPVETTAPSIQIIVPTTNTSYTSATDLLNLSGTAADNETVAKVVLRNSRDVADYTATGTTAWTFTGLPLFQGSNLVTVTAFDPSDNTASDTVMVVYDADTDYNDVLRSGNILQELNFPDNLIPGETVTMQWKVLSYVPIKSRVYAGIPGGWFFFQNAEYKGVEESTWNLNGRPAMLYAFECAWVVPQKTGDFKIWFNVAQTDSAQFMIPVIPDGVDDRADATYPKLIERTIAAGGNGSNPQSDPDTWISTNSFETIHQSKERSAVTITDVNMPDNLVQGSQVTCEWTVQSYIEVNAQLMLLNVGTEQVWLTADATLIGNPVNTTFYFKDRTTGTKSYAKQYTFQATFTVPNQPGDQQFLFRSQDLSNTNSAWMAENLSAGADPRSVRQNGLHGRLIERTIQP